MSERLHDFIVSFLKRHPRIVISILIREGILRGTPLAMSSVSEFPITAVKTAYVDCIYRVILEEEKSVKVEHLRKSLKRKNIVEILHEVKTSKYSSQYKKQLMTYLVSNTSWIVPSHKRLVILWIFKKHYDSYVGNLPRFIRIAFIDWLAQYLKRDLQELKKEIYEFLGENYA